MPVRRQENRIQLLSQIRIQHVTQPPDVVESPSAREDRQSLHIVTAGVRHVAVTIQRLCGRTPLPSVKVRKIAVIRSRQNAAFRKSTEFIDAFQREPGILRQVCQFLSIVMEYVLRTHQECSTRRRDKRHPVNLGLKVIAIDNRFLVNRLYNGIALVKDRVLQDLATNGNHFIRLLERRESIYDSSSLAIVIPDSRAFRRIRYKFSVSPGYKLDRFLIERGLLDDLPGIRIEQLHIGFQIFPVHLADIKRAIDRNKQGVPLNFHGAYRIDGQVRIGNPFDRKDRRIGF